MVGLGLGYVGEQEPHRDGEKIQDMGLQGRRDTHLP